MINVAFKTPVEIRLGICVYKTSLLHRPDDYIGFTPRCPLHILQQNCAHGADHKLAALSTTQICLQELKMKEDHVSCLAKI